MGSKARLTIIANYLEALERPLRMKEIHTDCIINSCSPLAMAGEYDGRFEKYSSDINMPMPTLLNIRKNISAMLSRDRGTFDQNYNLQPYARNVRYENETDYIVIMNTLFGYTLFVKDKAVYSDTYPQNGFIKEIKADGSYIKQSFPYEDHFDWRQFYDKFICAVMREYDSSHIILVRVHSAQWYMDSQEICPFEDPSAGYRRRIEEIDEYFLEKTHCMCIDEQFNFIPAKKEACAFMYSSKSAVFYQRLVGEIESIVDGRTGEFEYRECHYLNPLAGVLDKKLSVDILKRNRDAIDAIENRNMSMNDLSNASGGASSHFYRDLTRLNRFVGRKNNDTLSDYAIELLGEPQYLDNRIDFEILELYVRYLKLNIDDIIAVYMLYSHCRNKSAFRNIVKNMIGNNDCLPVRSVRKLRRQNVCFLEKYPYIYLGLKNVNETEYVYVRIENNVYLRINLSADNLIEKLIWESGKILTIGK